MKRFSLVLLIFTVIPAFARKAMTVGQLEKKVHHSCSADYYIDNWQKYETHMWHRLWRTKEDACYMDAWYYNSTAEQRQQINALMDRWNRAIDAASMPVYVAPVYTPVAPAPPAPAGYSNTYVQPTGNGTYTTSTIDSSGHMTSGTIYKTGNGTYETTTTDASGNMSFGSLTVAPR